MIWSSLLCCQPDSSVRLFVESENSPEYDTMARLFKGFSVALMAPGAWAATLKAYSVDAESVSVSGLSAGGFMSVQLGVAYSDTFKTGFGVFAGGPYDCARDQPVCVRHPIICFRGKVWCFRPVSPAWH